MNIWRQFAWAIGAEDWTIVAFDVLIEIGVLLASIWLLFFSFVKLGWSPVGLDVEDNGLTFHFRKGKDLRVGWTDPRLNLLLEDRRSHSRAPSQTRLRVVFSWRALPSAYVTEPAWDAVLDSARRSGARITEESRKQWPDYGRPVQRICIRTSVRPQ